MAAHAATVLVRRALVAEGKDLGSNGLCVGERSDAGGCEARRGRKLRLSVRELKPAIQLAVQMRFSIARYSIRTSSS